MQCSYKNNNLIPMRQDLRRSRYTQTESYWSNSRKVSPNKGPTYIFLKRRSILISNRVNITISGRSILKTLTKLQVLRYLGSSKFFWGGWGGRENDDDQRVCTFGFNSRIVSLSLPCQKYVYGSFPANGNIIDNKPYYFSEYLC